MMPATKKTFHLRRDDIVDLSEKNEPLKNGIGPQDEKWLEYSKAKLLKQIGDKKRANFILCRKEKHMKIQY